MREERDCHNAAIATACQVSYEQASKATEHKDLPGMLESPVFSNPWNMYRALVKLGYWKRNITWSHLLSGDYAPLRTIVLIKDSLLQQHWIVLGVSTLKSGKREYRAYWGDSEKPRTLTEQQLKELFLNSWPNCAFQVYKANFFRLMWEKFKMLFS